VLTGAAGGKQRWVSKSASVPRTHPSLQVYLLRSKPKDKTQEGKGEKSFQDFNKLCFSKEKEIKAFIIFQKH